MYQNKQSVYHVHLKGIQVATKLHDAGVFGIQFNYLLFLEMVFFAERT